MNNILYFVYFFLINFLLIQTALVSANSNAISYDCTTLIIDEYDTEILTAEEEIALLDEVLLESIDRHQDCIGQMAGSLEGEEKGQGKEKKASDDQELGKEANSNQTKEKNTEQSEANNKQTPTEQTKPDIPKDSTNNETRKLKEKIKQIKEKNGKKSESLPEANNNCVIKRQLHERMQQETDAVKKAKLEKLYNSYQC